jgi:hypothetical protein
MSAAILQFHPGEAVSISPFFTGRMLDLHSFQMDRAPRAKRLSEALILVNTVGF